MKSLTKLKHYVAQSKIIILTTHPNVRSYIMQGKLVDLRPAWVSKIMKYDVEFRPVRTIKGRALCENLAMDVGKRVQMVCITKGVEIITDPMPKQEDWMS